MQDPTEAITNNVRVIMSNFAIWLNKVFNGKLKPAHITTLSLLGHIPAAWALWTGRPYRACIYIAVFGLMDALDGALARAQNSASKQGMFYDAVTDRMKEVLLYSGLAVYVSRYLPETGVWVVPAVAGSSLLVSYVKAKGEMAVSDSMHDKQTLNRVFSSGFARYEIRMVLLIFGLITGYISPLLNLIIALNLATAAIRFVDVIKLLGEEETIAKVKITKKHDKS